MKINEVTEGKSPLGKINKFLSDKKRKEEYARKLQQQRDEKDSVKEDFGSVPPLPELILMAIAAKTTVDILKGSFKVAIKTGKGLKKLNDLRKRVVGAGERVADYAMPHESVTEDEGKSFTGFDPQTVANLKIIKARYPHAPDELSALMKFLLDIKGASQKADGEHSAEIDSILKRLDKIEAKKVGEAVNKDEYMKKFANDQKNRFYQAALDALHHLVTTDSGRGSVGGHALDIARAFNGIDARELEKMYNANQ